ncbi:nuclear transcription factor Y subunit B-1-like isoform X1 [Solanum pennellii]|uniref:Nuclear transcription factor Y subunit B-1-like isoform X1 n=2 Tax=Solanum pennellii TaxID=28526 RepID=A0ABM1VAP7_SOLPN|nr:nuclear transcription factor Y subunit B-1-like isoform X1 [Solanum pennellii]XP_027772815.1 nuclear transcription factor Y subunit B-1-like isoform X1 [Solanum pennellii]
MDDGNLVGLGDGGFHSYCRSPQRTSASSPSPDMEMSLELPADLEQTIAANVEHSERTIREHDRFMPITNVIRIMRKILPPNVKISDGFKLMIQECVSEFIGFITGEANNCCQLDQRKTITAEDLLRAMDRFGYDDYVETLALYLHRYREYDGGCRSTRRERLLLRSSMVNPASGCNITPYQGDASNGSTSQGDAVNIKVQSPAKETKE